MIELSQKEAENRASKVKVPALTEEEIFDLVQFDFATNSAAVAARVALGLESIKYLRKRAKEAIDREVFNRQFREWAKTAGPQWDNHRQKYVCYGLNK